MNSRPEPGNSEIWEQAEPGKSPVFATTHWSVVLAAGDSVSPESTAALERLCQSYWYPLYAHVRRRGYSPADAEDLTQSFIAHLLQRHSFQRASPSRGRFRSFLLSSLNYFLNDAYDRATAQKRGGGIHTISFDAHAAEERYQLEPIDPSSPDRIFERRWAASLMDTVLARLKAEFEAAGKGALFGRLWGYLGEKRASGTYAEAARDLGATEEAVQKMVQRLRRRYGELFREEIAHTVGSAEDVDRELRYLCELMSEGRSG